MHLRSGSYYDYVVIGQRCILAVYGFGKGIRYDRVPPWYVADAKSVWSWRKIVESIAKFVSVII